MRKLNSNVIEKLLKINSTILQVEHIKNRYDFKFKSLFPFEEVMCLVIDFFTIEEFDLDTILDEDNELLVDLNNLLVNIYIKFKDTETDTVLGSTNLDEAIYIASVFIDKGIDVLYKSSLK